ncbi:uncharacterized protein LOC144821916 [Lissotriton helveticus]
MGFRALLLTLGIVVAILESASSSRSVTLFTVDNQGVIRAGQPPPAYNYDFISRARVLGKLSGVSHVLFSPRGLLYVVKGYELYSGPMPSNPSRNWFQSPGRRIGKGGWAGFKHFFFHPKGDLYAVTNAGELYAGPPPTNENQNWLGTRGIKIGGGGWGQFSALFFDPRGILYAVTGGKLLKARPPVSTADNWIGRSQTIGGGGWSDLSHFMSFTPDGNLWCVSKSDGKIYRASPPTSVNDVWIGRARNLGHSYFFKFMAFTTQ